MDRSRRFAARRTDREDTPPPPPPAPSGSPIPTDPTQMMGFMRDMLAMMQQTQQAILQQQQQFYQQHSPHRTEHAPCQGHVGPPRVVPYVKLHEFVKLVPEFNGQKVDPVAAESWIEEIEKAFVACDVPEDRKLGLAVYQLKKDAYNWWRLASRGMQ